MTASSGLDTALTPLSFLEKAARVFPEATAVVDGPRRQSYAEFADRATRLASLLRMRGVARGDRVGVLAPNSAEALLAQFAVPLAGGAVVALNTRLAAPEVAYITEHAGISVLIADAGLLAGLGDEVPESISLILVTPDADGTQPDPARFGPRAEALEEGLALASPQPVSWAVEDEDAVIAVNYTSGTTGRPKGVMYTHRGAYLNALGEIITQGLDADSRYLWTLPMFHCNGWCTTWALTGAMGTHVCLRAVRGDEIWRLFDDEGINRLAGAPAVLSTIADDPAARPVTGIRMVTAGAPPSPTILRRFEDLGIDVTQVYGLTETYGPFTVCTPQPDWADLDPDERAGLKSRQGVAMIHADTVRVVERTSPGEKHLVDVPADGVTMGEVVMTGNGVMKGYFADPEATATAFAGGWFHSGDLGVMHPDGYVQLLDRAKDVVVSGGENISTIEVEQAIAAHPDVVDCAVVSMPDEKWGERPKAYVVVKPGSDLDEDGVIDHCRTRIARYKVPGAVELTEALPRTSTGKVRKNELRDAAWSGWDKRIN
ncbi:MAG: AMP-binding protein [Dietzia sp.]|uniref:AMP-binding protein n=4 Tax=Dietzia TaxID=37914 RepID=A0ABN2I3G0_9ACTN|nr:MULTISPECIES: AMP-binding protein [Dietzia]MBB1038714.1 AMP-binding protein [Dietzia natronolimnaea]MBB1048478.1 AMP-binding protein [Dietzia cercidiphylli]MBB1051110.1 AMP-binding protein [Dietzia sp. CW19]MDO8395913.1 AMP-binding protein [Dietzia sp.]